MICGFDGATVDGSAEKSYLRRQVVKSRAETGIWTGH
jgi:hypothetical protein